MLVHAIRKYALLAVVYKSYCVGTMKGRNKSQSVPQETFNVLYLRINSPVQSF